MSFYDSLIPLDSPIMRTSLSPLPGSEQLSPDQLAQFTRPGYPQVRHAPFPAVAQSTQSAQASSIAQTLSAKRVASIPALNNKSQIDMSKSNGAAFVNKTIDNVDDGTAYLRSPQFAGGINLAENGNMEASQLMVNGAPPGWAAQFSTLSYEVAAPQSGSQSLIVNASQQFGNAQATRKYSAKPGDAFRVTGFIWQVSNVSPVIELVFLDANGNALGSPVAAGTSATSAWTFCSGTGVAPSGTVSAQLFLDITGASGGIAKFDNIFCTRQATSFELTPTSTSGGPTATTGLCSQVGTTLAISVAASTWVYGDGTINFNSGSVTPASFGLWYVYADNPSFMGGSLVFVATAVPSDVTAANGRLFFGKITTVSGGGAVSVGGGTGGGTIGKASLA